MMQNKSCKLVLEQGLLLLFETTKNPIVETEVKQNVNKKMPKKNQSCD